MLTSSNEEILQRLKSLQSESDEYSIQKRAAVLVPLVVNSESGELHIILTLRSKFLRTHAGEVAFPGGKKDDTDPSLIHTALRESEEEIGLTKDLVKILSQLPPALAKNNILVTPIVGLVDSSFEPKPNPDEVSACFTVPLKRFISSEGHGFIDLNWLNRPFRMHKFEWAGFTAQICISVAEIAYGQNASFEVCALGQPSHDVQIREVEWALGEIGGKQSFKSHLI